MNRKSNLSSIFVAAVLLAGCETQPGDPDSARGISFVRAVALQVSSAEDGFAQEQAWLKQHHPELMYRDIRVEIINGRGYDVLAATNASGERKEFYFDAALSSAQPVLPPTVPIPASQSAPAYPIDLKFEGVTGYAIVRFIVERDGSVSGPVMVRQSLPQFGKAAIESVRKWTYEPATKFGAAVRMSLQVTLYFTLAPKK